MTIEFSEEKIESTKDSLSNTISLVLEDLIENYLNNKCYLVEERLDGYDDCSFYCKVYKQADEQLAKEEAKSAIKEVLKQLGY
ncbi:MAG: hypothetical protein EBS06_05290 [Proteobacteria bacterium]|nr:hypothetical protein [Pseudomonadota bacterium]